MFEVCLAAFSASFWKDFLVEVLPRKGHPGDADDVNAISVPSGRIVPPHPHQTMLAFELHS